MRSLQGVASLWRLAGVLEVLRRQVRVRPDDHEQHDAASEY